MAINHTYVKLLALNEYHCHSFCTMRRWSCRQIFVLMLGFSVALSMSLSVVQTASMAAKMSSAADMVVGGPDHGTCDGCDSTGNDMVKKAPCASVCTAGVFVAIMPPIPSAGLVARSASHVISAVAMLTGRGPPPEPYPPKPSVLS